MSDLKNEEIAVIKKLLGYIEPAGETYEDKERLKNVSKYYDILWFIVSKLKEASKSKDRVEASMNEIGSECYDILQELKESLEDLEDENLEDENLDSEELEATKSADEMFEEIGYKKDKYEYYSSEVLIEYCGKYKIDFDLYEHEVSKCTDWEEPVGFTMQELNIINKKCKELGWLE